MSVMVSQIISTCLLNSLFKLTSKKTSKLDAKLLPETVFQILNELANPNLNIFFMEINIFQ